MAPTIAISRCPLCGCRHDFQEQKMAKNRLICSGVVVVMLLLSSLTTASEALFEHGLLWQVEKPGGVASHILGTIHSDDPRILNLPLLVRQSLNHSTRYVMEVKLQPDLGMVATMMAAMLLPEGQTLDKLMGAEQYQRVSELALRYGMPDSSLRKMKPWAVATTLALPKSNGAEILDLKLDQLAKKQGLITYGLERVEEQLDIFDGLSMEDQVALLIDTVDNHPRIVTEMERLTEAYLARDLAAIWAIQEESKTEGNIELNQRLMERMLDERNQRMVTRMLPHLKQGRAFVAIGALHLPGELGVLNLLKQQGYRISRVY